MHTGTEETHLKDKRSAKAYLQISGASLERAMRDPHDPLPYLKIGNLVRFDPYDLADWLQRRRVQRSGDAA
jgi:hypothetical protein